MNEQEALDFNDKIIEGMDQLKLVEYINFCFSDIKFRTLMIQKCIQRLKQYYPEK